MMKKSILLAVLVISCFVLYGTYVCVYAAGEDVELLSAPMTPKLLTTSLKQKGNKYTYSFPKGTSSHTTRSKVIPLKVDVNGPVTITSNKSKLSYGVYQDQNCHQKVAITQKGTYYVRISQPAYAIDLLDHNKAQYKKASIILYVSQVYHDDFTLKAKTYACFSGTPAIHIHAKNGLLKLNSSYLDQTGKYVKGGHYTLGSVTVKEDPVALMKGDYILKPDGKHTYRLKYTFSKLPSHKNVKEKKASTISVHKTSKGVFLNNDKNDRFYKMVMAQAGSLSFDLSLLDSDVYLYHRDAKKNVVNDALSKSQVDAHTMRYHAQVNAGTYYVKVHKAVKSPIGAYYTITRQS